MLCNIVQFTDQCNTKFLCSVLECSDLMQHTHNYSLAYNVIIMHIRRYSIESVCVELVYVKSDVSYIIILRCM